MVYASILASGKGTRMGNTDLPKQFLNLGSKPIIIHTIEQFMINEKIDKVLVCCKKEWINYMQDLLKKYIKGEVLLVEGGESRDETLMNSCKYIEKNFGLKDDDVILTHDAVRPFVTQKIINENIKAVKKYGAVDTVIKTTDTIIEAQDDLIKNIPDRNSIYRGQTPQTFNIKKLMKLHDLLTDKERDLLTDACKIFVMKNEKVSLVEGEEYNMKITTMFDLKLANSILNVRDK